ncbi:MAG: DUF3617 domain-containing protein [Burkholderiaceae bacterium]
MPDIHPACQAIRQPARLPLAIRAAGPACAALLTAASLFAATATSAQTLPQRKAGLWEIQMTHGGALADLQKQAQQQMQQAMAGMTPAQRQQMQQMLGAQGMSLPGAGPQTVRSCLTPEQAARELDVQPDPDSDCRHTITSRSSTHAEFKLSCQSPEGRMEGTGRIFDVSPTSFRAQMTMKGTSGELAALGEMRIDQNGRWLGADCKGVRR